MQNEDRTSTVPGEKAFAPSGGALDAAWRRVVRRRAFLQAGVGVGLASAAVPASALWTSGAQAHEAAGRLTEGDVAILRLLAAIELIESDLWVQYNELGGANGVVGHSVFGTDAAYVDALSNLDGDMPQYISDNTDDELSHAAFLNAYLKSKGAQQVNLDRFRRLSSSTVNGVPQIGRLTNLQTLDVDTSFYTRYRSPENPDLGATFPQAVTITKEPGIPVRKADDSPSSRIQAIANTAAFHFGFIEQGGASLYSVLALKATSLEVLRIIVSIGGVETDHFSLWHDKLGNAVATPVAPVTDPITGIKFPDLNAKGGELNQTNLILPEPCGFISEDLPECSVIRPTLDQFGGAVATLKAFTADRLFLGQSDEFFDTVMALAQAADAAQRGI
jgi:hypothetical protein